MVVSFESQTLLADFCMDPGTNVLGILPGSSMKNILHYYIMCSGDNPLEDLLVNSTVALQAANSTIHWMGTNATLLGNQSVTGLNLRNCSNHLQHGVRSYYTGVSLFLPVPCSFCVQSRPFVSLCFS